MTGTQASQAALTASFRGAASLGEMMSRSMPCVSRFSTSLTWSALSWAASWKTTSNSGWAAAAAAIWLSMASRQGSARLAWDMPMT